MQNNYRPIIGISLGDQAGIGPEIVLKLLCRPHLYDKCQPVLIGNYELLCKMAERIYPSCLLMPYSFEDITSGKGIKTDLPGIPIVNIDGDIEHVILGMVTNASGMLTYNSILTGYRLLERGIIDGLILAPSTKESISKSGCGFHSEYEILENCVGTNEIQTVVKGGKIMRISAVGHVPFRDIPESLTVEQIVKVGRRLHNVIKSVQRETPKILVASLNPMEDEEFGYEETEIICPAINILKSEGMEICGPFPADSLINLAEQEQYNGIIYMYHDQGNIAMKAQMFQTTACIYTDTVYPILSTGHGSALDIADLGIANPTNISYVLTVMTDILSIRNEKSLLCSKTLNA